MSETDMDVDLNEVIPRPNAVWIHGVEDLSTNDIKSYIKTYSDEDFKIEWINDSSLNIVFEKDEDANSLLSKISIDEISDDKIERLIHPLVQSKRDIAFTARISDSQDKKVKNAAQYSRYYLFNPKEHERGSRSKKSGYREREPASRRRRRGSEDDIDLFPSKVSSESDSAHIIQSEDIESNSSLLGRIGENLKVSEKIASKDLDDDDLFKK